MKLELIAAPQAELGEPITLEQAKEKHVRAVLLELGGNITHAAKVLAVHRRTLHRLMARYGIERSCE